MSLSKWFFQEQRLPRPSDAPGHHPPRMVRSYVVDFACFSLKLIVELDGPQHLDDDAAELDARRTAWLSARGFHVIRFRNQQLDEDIPTVMSDIARALEELEAATTNPPSPTLPAEGRGPEKIS